MAVTVIDIWPHALHDSWKFKPWPPPQVLVLPDTYTCSVVSQVNWYNCLGLCFSIKSVSGSHDIWLIELLIDWCSTPTLAVFRLYRGMNKFYFNVRHVTSQYNWQLLVLTINIYMYYCWCFPRMNEFIGAIS
jgi:hypothetical protein